MYLARDMKSNSDVAIKILAGHPYSEREKALFDREFAAVKNLNHPGVVKVYDEGDGYFTMEYVPGEPLSKKKGEDVAQIFEIGIDIIRVLDYIHRQGVIHRDLKPDNIKITSASEVKILDFGFAVGSEVNALLSAGQMDIVGTLDYMAPEVIKAFEVDPRADLYSLGIIFYELVTGRLPFKSSDILTTVVKQVEMIPPLPSEFNPKITPSFEAIIMKLIAKSPVKRFQSTEELLSAMMRLAGRSEIIKIKVDRGRKILNASQFVGGDRYLEYMLAAFKKAMKGRGSFVLIRGEEGVGKTRLIHEFQARHRIGDAVFVHVACESTMSAPFAAFAQVLYEYFQILEKSGAKFLLELAKRWGPTMLPIVPALTHKSYMFGVAPGDDVSGVALRQQLCHFVVEISKQQPLGIFIDNLHWLDQDSCHLILDLVQETQDHPVFLCGVYRDSFQTGGSAFQRILPILKLKKLCEEIELRPLSNLDLSALLSSMVGHVPISDEVKDRVYEVSRGVPLLAEEAIRNMADDGLVYRKGGHWYVEVDDVRKIRRPGLLEDGLMEKYEKLDRKSASILEAAAIIGGVFHREILTPVCRLDAQEVDNCLPPLIEQGFLSEIPKKTEVCISIGSPRLAELLYEKIPHKPRQKLHEEIAKFLEGLPAREENIENLARHYFQTRHIDKALYYLGMAGETCEKNYAYGSAVEYYKNALDLAREKQPQGAKVTDLLKKLGNIHSRIGQYELALTYYQDGIKAAGDKKEEKDDFHKGIGIVHLQRSKFGEALKHFKILLESMRPKHQNISEELALTASVHLAMGSYEDAENLLKEALNLARRDKKRELQASIYRWFGEMHFTRGYWQNAINYYSHALDILQLSGDQHLKAQIARGLAHVYVCKGSTKPAYKYLENALYFCHLTGDRELRVMVEMDLGFLLEYEGELDQAVDIYRESLELANDLSLELGVAQASLHLGRAMCYYEKHEEALEYLNRSKDVFEELQMLGHVGECHYLLGEVYSELGEYEKALHDFKIGEKALMTVRNKWKLAEIYAGVARAYQRLGKQDRANKSLNKALKFAKKYDYEIIRGRVHIRYALFCAAQGLNKESIEHFVSATVFLEKVTCLLDLAVVYYEYGKVLLDFERQGDQGFIKVAVHQLEKAKEIFSKAGIQSRLNKTMHLIKECQREKSDALYKKDLVVKLREFGRELAEFERDGAHELESLKTKLLTELGGDMEKEKILEEMDKRIAEVKGSLHQRLSDMEKQNAALLSRVEELKAEREGLLTLQKISNVINSVLDSQKLLNMIMDMVVRELRAERGAIVLKDEKEGFIYKAARNIDKEELSRTDSDLSYSIVKKVIKTGEPVLTSDAQADGRFQSQSIVDLKLRSILCVPFTIKDRVIGAVYVDNRFVSGLFTERDLDFLVAFSNQAAVAIENAFLYEELAEKERMEQELSIAARIQAGLLPKALPEVPGVEVYGKMIPAREVGGDYYDFIEAPDKSSLTIVIGDVSGKGIPAGLVMVMARLILHHFLRDTKASTKETLLAANQMLKDNTEPFIFMSLLLMRWDSKVNKFIYTGAGHENLVVCYAKDNRIETIPAGGVVLGVKENIEDFLEERELILSPGDCVIFYTDGVTECNSKSGDMLELDGFVEMVKKHTGKSAKEMVDRLLAELQEFMGGAEQHDDITLTIVKKL